MVGKAIAFHYPQFAPGRRTNGLKLAVIDRRQANSQVNVGTMRLPCAVG